MVALYLSLLLQFSPPPPYHLPWLYGEERECNQGNNGSFSHNGDYAYAFDFRMPPGTKVLAARGGKVTVVKENETEGGADPKLKDKANLVLIDHGDGTTANYVHLQKDGVLVELGATIVAGDVIALSGQTGWATEPHLHFHVARSGTRVAIPVAFADVADGGVPKSNGTYRSQNPTGLADDVRAQIRLLDMEVRLAIRYGAYTLAWPRLTKLSEYRLRVSFEPSDSAKRRLEDLAKKGEAHSAAIDKMPISEGARAYLLARRAWDETPVKLKLDKLSMQSKLGWPTAQAKAANADRAQDLFLQGLRLEFDGKSGAAPYKDAVKAAPDSEFAGFAKERLDAKR